MTSGTINQSFTVEKGTERLRFAPTPFHTDGMISDLADKLNEVYHD